MGKWKLEGFVDALARWNDSDHAPDVALRASILSWLLTEFARDPFPPGSEPLGGEFDLSWWFVAMPFGSTPATRVVCTYRVDTERRTLTCHGIEELRLPI